MGLKSRDCVRAAIQKVETSGQDPLQFLEKGSVWYQGSVPVRTEYAASGKSVGTATGELAHCTAFRIIALGTVSDTIVDEIVITLTLP